MTLEQRLKNTARRFGIPSETILKDYVIGHVLSALAAEPAIAETLVMKARRTSTSRPSVDPVGQTSKRPSARWASGRRGTRRWVRPRGRDVYDLWRILTSPPVPMDRGALRRILPAKCAVRGVTYTTSADFFPEPLIALVRQRWEDDLGALVAELPPIDDVIPVLKADVAQLLGET